jgi:hypothetical protein
LRKVFAAAGIATAIIAGAVACGSSPATPQYDYVVQYGYYDTAHHYHYYTHPKTVRVTHKYYVTHTYQYKPHGTQHTIKVATPKPMVKPKTYKPTTTTPRKAVPVPGWKSTTRKRR